MCENCKNSDMCVYREYYEILCLPMEEEIIADFGRDKIFSLEVKCNYKNKPLPYRINTPIYDTELSGEIDRILKGGKE